MTSSPSSIVISSARNSRLVYNPHMLINNSSSSSASNYYRNYYSVKHDNLYIANYSSIINCNCPNFEVKPLTNSLRRPRPHQLLRHFYKVFGLDLFQGKRITFAEIEKQFSVFSTRAEMLNAIDISALLRWVPKTDRSWLDVSDNNTINEKEAENEEEQSLLPRLSLAKTEVYRYYIGKSNYSIISRPQIAEGVFKTSAEAAMRKRRQYLYEKRAQTHDVILLGTPSHVLGRFASQDLNLNFALRISRCAFTEGFSHFLDYGEFTKRKTAQLIKQQKEFNNFQQLQQQQQQQNSPSHLNRMTTRSNSNSKSYRSTNIWEEMALSSSTTTPEIKQKHSSHQDTDSNTKQDQEQKEEDHHVDNDDTTTDSSHYHHDQRDQRRQYRTSQIESEMDFASERKFDLKRQIILQKQKEALEEQRLHEYFPEFTRTLQTKVPCFSTCFYLTYVRNRQSFIAIPQTKLEIQLKQFASKQNTTERETVVVKALAMDISFHQIPFPVSTVAAQQVRATPTDGLDISRLVFEVCEERERQSDRARKFFSLSNNTTTSMKPRHLISFAYQHSQIMKEEEEAQQVALSKKSPSSLNELNSFFYKSYTKRLHLDRSTAGPVAMLVLSKRSKFGSTNDNFLIDESGDCFQTMDEMVKLGIELDDATKKNKKMIMMKEDHQNADYLSDGTTRTIKNHHHYRLTDCPPLVAWMGNDLIIKNIFTAIERASKIAAAITNVKIPQLENRSIWAKNSLGVFSQVKADDEIQVDNNESSSFDNFVLVPDSQVAVIRNFKYLSKISGWTSEFGSSGACGEILLQRLLLGCARDCHGLLNFTLNVSEQPFDTDGERYAAAFFVKPIRKVSMMNNKSDKEEETKSSNNTSNKRNNNNNSRAPTHWAVAIPDPSVLGTFSSMKCFRDELLMKTNDNTNFGNKESDATNSNKIIPVRKDYENILKIHNMVRHLVFEISQNTTDDNDDDDDVDEQQQQQNKIYIMLVRNSRLVVENYRKEKEEAKEIAMASLSERNVHTIGGSFKGERQP